MPPRSKKAKAAAACPALLEYRPLLAVEPWRVERFELLAAEFNLQPATGNQQPAEWARTMALFHEAAAVYPLGWLCVRRLYGVAPLMPAPDAAPDDLRVWQRNELCVALGKSPEELAGELDAVRVMYANFRPQNSSGFGVSGSESDKPETRNPKPETTDETAILQSLGFEPEMFDIEVSDPASSSLDAKPVKRSPAKNAAERKWFVERIALEQWKMMLLEPLASVVAREALLGELTLRRLQEEMTPLAMTSKKYRELASIKAETEERYREQLAKLQQMYPERDIASKMTARATIAGLVLAMRDYYAHGDNRRVDGIRTVHEIDVQLTPSVQNPIPQHRLGQTLYFLESAHHFGDPNFRSQFRPQTLRKLDMILPKWMEEARQLLGERLVDLSRGVSPGEGDDFPDFPVGEESAAAQIAQA